MPKKNGNRKKSRGRGTNPVRGVGVTNENFMQGYNLLAPPISRSLTPIGFPPVFRMQHRYVQSSSITAAVGSLATQVYRTNSLFDPDLTGVGHQPYGFDQFKTYYATYLVTASTCSVEASIATASALVGLTVSTDSALAALTTADTLTEPGRGQAGILNPVDGTIRTFQAKWALKDIPGHDPADYSALVGANPTNSDFYTVYAQEAFSLAGSPVCVFTTCIVYDVEYRDPITVVAS
jgi:hypothetical protein